MAKKSYGKTASGKPITDDLVEKLAAEAEAGYDVRETLRRRPGRPAMGSAAARVESVRLDPELRAALQRRADRDRTQASEVIRTALRLYLSETPLSSDRAPNSGKRWTRSEETTLRRLAGQRKPTRAIARELGRSEASVVGKADKLTLTLVRAD